MTTLELQVMLDSIVEQLLSDGKSIEKIEDILYSEVDRVIREVEDGEWDA